MNTGGPVIMETTTATCPVDGCDFEARTQAGLGPHLAAHRRKDSPPPVSERTKPPKKRPPRPPKKLEAADVADTVIDAIFPTGVPTSRVREVAAWIEATEHLVNQSQVST